MSFEDDLRLAQLVTEYLGGYEFAVDLVMRGDTALASSYFPRANWLVGTNPVRFEPQ